MKGTRPVVAVCPENCRRCGTGPLVANEAKGPKRHAGRGLCFVCRRQLDGTDELYDYPRITRSAEETYWDWMALTARNKNLTKRMAAADLGITKAALDQAICRYRRRLREGLVVS